MRPTLRRLSSGMNTYKTTSTLTGFVSGGDPSTLNLKRKVGEHIQNSRVLVRSGLPVLFFLPPFIDKVLVTVDCGPMFYDAKSSSHNHVVGH